MTSYCNKTVWITGASSGIGEALVYWFDRQGAHIILSARRKDELSRVLSQCEHQSHHQILPLDLSCSTSIEKALTHCRNQGMSIDILCNVAGLSQRSLVMDTQLDVHRSIMEVNYFGTVALTQGVLKGLLAEQGGVITVSSLVGKFTTPLRSAYSASKHAITAYMDSLRAELGDGSWQFTTIYPGFIRTNLTYKALLGDGTEQNSMDHAQEHGMAPEECARQMMLAYEKGREEAYIGGKERFGVYIKRFFPRLFARMIKRAKVV